RVRRGVALDFEGPKVAVHGRFLPTRTGGRSPGRGASRPGPPGSKNSARATGPRQKKEPAPETAPGGGERRAAGDRGAAARPRGGGEADTRWAGPRRLPRRRRGGRRPFARKSAGTLLALSRAGARRECEFRAYAGGLKAG